jgi:hypothetical protein
MDKTDAVLLVAKDLFLAGMALKPVKVPAHIKPDAVLEHYADEFLAFYAKLKSGVEA